MTTKAETITRAAELATVLAEAAAVEGKALYGNFAVVNAANVAELIKLADRIKARGIRACNFPMDDAQTERARRADDRAEARALEIARQYGATIIGMGDVRGFALKLILPTGRTNSFGEGWGV